MLKSIGAHFDACELLSQVILAAVVGLRYRQIEADLCSFLWA